MLPRVIGLLMIMMVFLTGSIGTEHRQYHSVKHHTVQHQRVVWREVTLTATAYVVNKEERGKCDTFTAHTASGTIPERGTVAVDPSQFPFGTRFRIPGYGDGVARDTGGAISWGRLDLAVMSCREAFAWGRRTVPVLVASAG